MADSKADGLGAQIRAVFLEMGGNVTLEALAAEVLRRGIIHPALVQHETDRQIQRVRRRLAAGLPPFPGDLDNDDDRETPNG